MKVILPILFLMSSQAIFSQTLSDQQAKAINNYVALANHLNQELSGLGPRLTSLYSQISQIQKKKYSYAVTPYVSKIDANQYYFDEVEKSSSTLGSKGANVSLKANQLISSFKAIDKTSKEMEIYFRLKDYESDNFKRVDSFLASLVTEIHQYKKDLEEFDRELSKLYFALQPYVSSNPYQKTEQLMRDQLAFEKTLIDAWTYNIDAENYTGWPSEIVEKHIPESETKIATLGKNLDKVKYPASSQYQSFISSVESMQETNRNAIDGNTYESQQSDVYSNNLYNNLINYYNNAAISFYNNYNKMAVQNGFRGLNYLTYVPVFDLRTESKAINTSVMAFVDLPYTPLKITTPTGGITATVHTGLGAYLEYINEGIRQINNLSHSMANLSSDAARGKGRLEVGEKVNINYYKNNFEPPISLFQDAISQTKNLPSAYRKPLTDQAETLQSILKEINQWNTVLLNDADNKQLAKDNLDHVYAILNRYKILIETFDLKKERLYNDVRLIFDSYTPANAKSSWVISGNELLKLVDEDHKELDNAKKFLTKETVQKPATKKINALSREIIVNEFENLNGIKKLGRYNGNCPYTPYEDLTKYSIQFTEFLEKVGTEKTSSYDRHPYNKLVRSYNGSLAHNYNKFVELSIAPLLKTASQIEIFEVVAPIPFSPRVYGQNTSSQEVPQKTSSTPTTNGNTTLPVSATSGRVIHDTVRVTDVIRIETIRQDTVYIDRVDTVYMGTLDADALSMEGYATNNMVLLLDVSGSMNNPDKLPLLKKSVLLLLKTMRQEDQISIVTYSGKAKVALSPTSFKEEEKIKKVIEQLESEGKTDGNAGLKLAFDVADKNYIRGGNNRIILATDGEFPIGNKSYEMVEKFANEDIMISVFNFGKNTSSKGLEKIAATGKGNYAYITQQNVDRQLIKEAKAKRKK